MASWTGLPEDRLLVGEVPRGPDALWVKLAEDGAGRGSVSSVRVRVRVRVRVKHACSVSDPFCHSVSLGQLLITRLLLTVKDGLPLLLQIYYIKSEPSTVSPHVCPWPPRTLRHKAGERSEHGSLS